MRPAVSPHASLCKRVYTSKPSQSIGYTLDIVTSLLFFTQVACYDRITKKQLLTEKGSIIWEESTTSLPNWACRTECKRSGRSVHSTCWIKISDGHHTARSSSTSPSSLS